ncbi:MAG: hypothetical protein ACTHJJ_15515 [Intrasporangium sp.]|uniref:hypothetical protein n=1 Tax=Intrasporangium sp. TaxID=1925024 RepID=UPI003F805837
MPTNDAEATTALRRRRRRRVLMAVVGCLLLACALAASVLRFSGHASPYAALDAYTSAVQTGNRAALEAVVGDGEQREALITRHADRPMTATTVSIEVEVWRGRPAVRPSGPTLRP